MITKGLVTHGQGKTVTEKIQFSNAVGSYCTSPGKYKIGNSYTGRFGLAFKLHGLESSNSNAFNRFVVLHAHDCVPNEEVYPQSICQSQGCPTVAPDFLQELSAIIGRHSKPILLEVLK